MKNIFFFFVLRFLFRIVEVNIDYVYCVIGLYFFVFLKSFLLLLLIKYDKCFYGI